MKLFTVGPVEMYQETLNISGRQLPYFRTNEFSQMMLYSEKTLLELAGASDDSRAVFLTASGTGAMEASIVNFLSQEDNALIIDGGSFGHRFVEICQRHHIPKTVVTLNFGEVLTREALEDAYTADITALLVNLHETSTGQLYDIKMISDFCRKHDIFLIVDAISAFLADPINMQEDGIDVLILSSQKAFALPPGLSTVLLSARAVNGVGRPNCEMLYFDLSTYLKNGERGQTPFTPAVGVLLALHNRLQEIKKTGLENVRKGIRDLALDFRSRVDNLPISIPNYPLSNAMTPIYFPMRNAKRVYDTLRKEFGLNVTPNGGILSDVLLRVGHIGNLSVEDNICLVAALTELLGRNNK